jgi:hypothetical protein
MTTKAWRIFGLIITGLSILFLVFDGYLKGWALSPYGWTAIVMISVAFVFTLVALIRPTWRGA